MLTVRLLGNFRLSHGDQPLAVRTTPRLEALLVYLILHRDMPQSRKHVAFLFWPDTSEKQAQANLRNLWHRLRRALPDAHHFLIADETTLQWRSGGCWVDVTEFETHLRGAGSAADADEQVWHLEQAVALYGGDLLPSCYSDWLLAERERLAQAYDRALEQLTSLHESRGDYRQAIAYAQALLRHDPLREPTYTRLMRLHVLDDNRAAALHVYHTCATVLRRELDVAPGSPTRKLYERLLNEPARPEPLLLHQAALPLVGRAAELAQLQAVWRAAAGRPGLVLISGEAGIGKTRLAEALAEWVARQDLPALTTRCYAAGGSLAYAPVVAWLRRRPRPPLAAPWLRELARLLPEIQAEHPDLPPPGPLTETWQRLRLFEALARALMAQYSAVLLFLDDLQWCDRDTLDWLGYLLQTFESQTQVLVIATLRTGDAVDKPALEAWKEALDRTNQLTEIELGPLSQEATLALADCLAHKPFDQACGSLLFQSTEGNPLFIVEMMRAGFGSVPGPMPAKVRQVLKARLKQLSPEARSTAELAAVIGRAFSYRVLADASDQSEAVLISCLDECWHKRIIRERENGAYDFSHDKLREAACAGLSQTRLRWLHGRVAEALERAYADDLDRTAIHIARHYEAAGLAAPAIAFYERAAAYACLLHAHTDALVFLDKAIDLLAALPPAQAAERSGLAARLHEARGDVLEFLMHRAWAQDAYAVALTYASGADTVAHARLHRKIGKSLEDERVGSAQAVAEYQMAEALSGAAEGHEVEAAW